MEIQNSKLSFIAILALIVIVSGCIGEQDVTPAFKALPEVQQLMKDHPNAKITVTYWSKEEVTRLVQEISQQCDKSIEPVAMYKVMVSEEDLKIVSWINAENKVTICSTTEDRQTYIPTVIATPIRTVATPQQTPPSPTILSIPSSYSIKVGIVQFGNMHNGIDPMPAINKWKSWIEANSKFNITIIYNKYPQLDSNEIPQKGYWDDGTPNYFVYPKDLSDVHKALIPKDTIVNFVLWNNEGKSPSMGGAEFGYNQYDQFQPFLSIPIGLWWDDGPNQQWTYPLTSGMVHEFENAIFGIVNTWLKIPDMATPEGCGGYGYNSSNDPEWIKCRTYVLSTITDKMYQAILAHQAVLPKV
ncbi:hypothetical protein KJ656_16510 [bacterium]|nr:hypothetical protein [bacterium]